MMELYEAMHTAIFEFDNNVAHSYKKVNGNCQLIQIVYVLYFDMKQIFQNIKRKQTKHFSLCFTTVDFLLNAKKFTSA